MDFKKNWSSLIHWFLTKPNSVGFLIFLILNLLFSFFIISRYQIIKEKDRLEMKNVLNAVNNNIENSLKNSYTTTLSLALTINDNGIPENFDYYGSQLLKSNTNIDVVQLAPKGIIKYIYPLKGNEKAMGLNLLEVANQKEEALKAIKNKQMYFAGPLNLKQGGVGIIGRLPVYNKNKFWGFSAVIIKLESLLKVSGIDAVDSSKYYFQISKQDPITQKEEFFLPQKGAYIEKYFISPKITDGNWRLYIYSKKQYDYVPYILLFGILSFVLSGLIGFIISVLLKKPAELQARIINQAAQLLNSEIKFKAIFDQAAIGIANIDTLSGNFIEVNKKFCKQLGYTQKEMRDLNFQSITHPDDLENDFAYLKKLREGKIRMYSYEKRYITKWGSVIWIHLTISPLWSKNEKISSHICVVEDITDRKNSEKTIKSSQKRIKSLINTIDGIVWECKADSFAFSFISKKVENILGYSSKEWLESPTFWMDHIYFEDRKWVLDYCEAKTKENTNHDFEYRMVAKDGTLVWLRDIVNVIREKDQATHLRGIMIDITKTKEAEKIIIDSQNKIEDLVNSIDGIVWECDYNTFELTFISTKSEEILGFTPQEWMADVNFWEKHIHPEDQLRSIESFKNLITSDNKQKSYEYRMITKQGKTIWIKELVNVIYENKIPLSIRAIMIDITKTKEAEEELKQSFDLVTEQNKRLLNFSYIVSHNLRSHTSNIEAITTLIDSSESEEETNQLLQLLKTVSGSLNETMHNLNEVVTINTNISLVSEPLNLNQYIANVQNILSEQIKLKTVSIVNNINDDVLIDYNPAYIESILLNLISNAIRYSHPERKPIITITFFIEKDLKVLEISDNGIGIDLKKNGNKIFGMYKTFSDNQDSRGIGLFISKNQIEAMGGSITVESKLNVGSTFKIFMT